MPKKVGFMPKIVGFLPKKGGFLPKKNWAFCLKCGLFAYMWALCLRFLFCMLSGPFASKGEFPEMKLISLIFVCRFFSNGVLHPYTVLICFYVIIADVSRLNFLI